MQDLQQERSTDGGTDRLAVLKGEVSGARMMETLSGLANFIKLAGTPAELESLDILSARFAAAGFDVSLILHDAYISLPGKASLRIGPHDYVCITHSMACPTPAGGLEAEIVDLGGGKPADIAGRDVAGKIVVVNGIATPDVAHRMSKLNAAGIIQVSPHEHLHEMCVSPVWGSPSLETLSNLPTCSVVTVSEADGALIRERLATSDTGRLGIMQAAVDTGWRKTPILVAEMAAPSAGADDPFVLFSGHHDTWHYGVMDNGSANATIAEVAGLVAGQHQQWKRGLRICIWSGHSQGRYSSSAWYVDQNWADFDKRCVAHVNIDSPGGIGASNLRNTGVMSALRPLAARAIAAETGQELAGKPKVRSADESLQGVGIPSMFGSLSGQLLSPDTKMRNALGWWWHTPQDLLDKIDEHNLVRDTKVVLECVWRLLGEDTLAIDMRAPVSHLENEVQALRDKLAGAVDMKTLTAGVEHLSRQLDEIYASADAKRINAAVMAVSRDLVMLEHSHGDRFVHEPAINQSVWPVLDPLRQLAAHAPDSDPFRFAQVGAVRAVNRLVWHVEQMSARLTNLAN